MTNGHDFEQTLLIVYGIENAIGAHPQPILLRTAQFLDAPAPWILF